MCKNCDTNLCLGCDNVSLGVLSCVSEANTRAMNIAKRLGATTGEMQRFEEFVNQSKPGVGWEKYRVVMTNDIKDLTGKGEEWLMNKHGEVVTKFFNGAMTTIVFDKSDIDVNEKTVITG